MLQRGKDLPAAVLWFPKRSGELNRVAERISNEINWIFHGFIILTLAFVDAHRGRNFVY